MYQPKLFHFITEKIGHIFSPNDQLCFQALQKELKSRDMQIGKLVTNCCDVCKRHNCEVPSSLRTKFKALSEQKQQFEKSIEDKLRELDQSVSNLEKLVLQ